jgi:hypothetical protein
MIEPAREGPAARIRRSEAADTGIDAGFPMQDVDRRAGEGKGPGMGRTPSASSATVPLEPDRDDDDAGAAPTAPLTDQRREQGDEGIVRTNPDAACSRPRRGSGAVR